MRCKMMFGKTWFKMHVFQNGQICYDEMDYFEMHTVEMRLNKLSICGLRFRTNEFVKLWLISLLTSPFDISSSGDLFVVS